MESDILKWLFEQIPVVVAMGLWIFFLIMTNRRLLKEACVLNEKKDALAADIVKLTTLWEAKASGLGAENTERHREIIQLLRDIKGIVEK